MTEYQVLIETAQDTWEEVGDPVEASSQEAAVRKVVAGAARIDDDASRWRAIPTRSWTSEPVEVEVEVETKVKIK